MLKKIALFSALALIPGISFAATQPIVNPTATSASAATSGQIVKSTTIVDCFQYQDSAHIPYDNTIPQIGEGTAMGSASFTMTSASNLLYITGTWHLTSDSVTDVIVAMFEDGAADAVAAASTNNRTSTIMMPVNIRYQRAGYSGAKTFAFRFGGPVGTTSMNRANDTANLFGAGKVCSMYRIEEIVP